MVREGVRCVFLRCERVLRDERMFLLCSGLALGVLLGKFEKEAKRVCGVLI